MNEITNKRIEKAIDMTKLFERYEKSNLSVRAYCEMEGIHTSKLYYWKDRYKKEGKKGLIDQRKGIPYKINKDEKAFIQRTRIQNKKRSGKDIAELFEKNYKKSITRQHINNILRELGLNDPVGRKTGKPLKKTND